MMIHLSMTQASDEFINQKALSSAVLVLALNLTHVVESTDKNVLSKLWKIVNKFLRNVTNKRMPVNGSQSDESITSFIWAFPLFI